MRRVALYAPMKPPDHPVPSGDRRMARLFIEALERAGYAPELASTLRLYDGSGDAAWQDELRAEAEAEAGRLTETMRDDPPALWFTYHCYYKAPDILGRLVSQRLRIPYVIAEATRARKRLTGAWAGFAHEAEAAIDAADIVLAMTAHDRFALERDRKADQRVIDFPPFLDPGPPPDVRIESKDRAFAPLRLLTVAMMRKGAKMHSFARLARALKHQDGAWTLDIIGDGPTRAETEALFADFGDRIRFHGEVSNSNILRQKYETADVFVWPGVEEAYGMVYLEAQAAGLPVIAEDHPGPRAVIGQGSRLTAVDDSAAFAQAIREVAQDPTARQQARDYILGRHSLDAAAERLRVILGELL